MSLGTNRRLQRGLKPQAPRGCERARNVSPRSSRPIYTLASGAKASRRTRLLPIKLRIFFIRQSRRLRTPTAGITEPRLSVAQVLSSRCVKGSRVTKRTLLHAELLRILRLRRIRRKDKVFGPSCFLLSLLKVKTGRSLTSSLFLSREGNSRGLTPLSSLASKRRRGKTADLSCRLIDCSAPRLHNRNCKVPLVLSKNTISCDFSRRRKRSSDIIIRAAQSPYNRTGAAEFHRVRFNRALLATLRCLMRELTPLMTRRYIKPCRVKRAEPFRNQVLPMLKKQGLRDRLFFPRSFTRALIFRRAVLAVPTLGLLAFRARSLDSRTSRRPLMRSFVQAR